MLYIMKTIIFVYSILVSFTISLLLHRVAFGAYTDEEDNKYAESRFLRTGPCPHLKKIVVASKDIVEFLNTTSVCDLKPGAFFALCDAMGKYKKTRFPYEPYGVNETLVPKKCQQYPIRFHHENPEEGRKSPPDEAIYFTTKLYWENNTKSSDPLVQARRCPTTKESPKFYLSDGRERRAIFMYMLSCPGRTHLRLEDYVSFAEKLEK